MLRRSLASARALTPPFGLLSLAIALAACTPEKPPTTPDQPQPAATASASASAAAGAPRGPDPYLPLGPFAEESFPTLDVAPLAAGALPLPAAPAGVAPAPAVCGEYLRFKAAATPACADRASALVALDRAVSTRNPAGYDPRSASAGNARDAALAALEGCAGLPSGMVRALRIDLLPVACGDVLAEPVLKAPPKDLRGDIHETLFGMALAARLSRAGGALPQMTAPFTEDRVKKHTSGPVAKWMRDVMGAVEDMSGAASKLHFYGGAIAAVAAGVADLQLVETVRAVPIPEEYQKDEERKNIYYASLDERLEPRKTRGRDAALIGLKKFAEVGVIADERVREARRLLSKLYGGRRIDALDRLIVPELPPVTITLSTIEMNLAQHLPTFYAGLVIDPKQVTTPAVLIPLAAQGLPLAHRQALRATAPSPELAPLVAHAHLALGRTYWRATDLEEAAKAMATVTARTPETKLLAALSIALRGGPRDAIEMMVRSPLGMNALGQRAALDALAAEPTPLSGAAAFDAAYLMEIAAPERADGIFFKSLAKRYRAAAAQLTDERQKAEAEERAKSVEAIAGEVK